MKISIGLWDPLFDNFKYINLLLLLLFFNILFYFFNILLKIYNHEIIFPINQNVNKSSTCPVGNK